MVAIVTGNGLGLERGSGKLLGGLGQLGDARLGRVDELAYVNAANGNLILQRTDEMLFGRGPDTVVARTYNSLGGFTGGAAVGTLSGQSGDNWRLSTPRQVMGLTGTVNTSGSTITRIDWDGSEIVYGWNSGSSAYLSTDGAGGYDKLTFSSTTGLWTWTDGDTQLQETYDNATGLIQSSKDTFNNVLTYAYAGGVTRVTTAGGDYTEYVYSGSQLTELRTFNQATAGGAFSSLTRTRYSYDASGRLTTVTVDLTPTDNSVADGATYVTTYAYDGTSRRISSVTQSDGSQLQVTYVQVGAEHRVASVTEAVTSGVTRTTTFAYDTVNRTTTVTGPDGLTTVLGYDTKARLTSLQTPPAQVGAPAQLQTFTYDSSGNVTRINRGGGQYVDYSYDSRGFPTLERDAAGNTITRTFTAEGRKTSETVWAAPDPDGSGSALPTGPQTTRYVYTSAGFLWYTVSAEGRVTRYGSNAAGQTTSATTFTGATYDLAGLSPTTAISSTSLTNWVSALTDKSAQQRIDYAYDLRGAVSQTTAFGKIGSDGNPTTAPTERTVTHYVYDASGRLVSRRAEGTATAETYLYDGLGRTITRTDAAGAATTIQFIDASTTTVVTYADGSAETSVYNKAGALLTQTRSGGTQSSTTSYRYDALGRLRFVTGPTGERAHVLYDDVGRKIAEIGPNGAITEFRYDTIGQLLGGTTYASRLTAAQLASLVTAGGEPAAVALSAIRPASHADDRWDWRVYDTAGRLVQTIDALGGVVGYAYDGTSRLVSRTAYATPLSAAALAALKTTAPTTPQSVTANAAADRTERSFYDKDGLLVGQLDAEGYLSRRHYDGAGQLSRVERFATATSPAQRATGSLADLLPAASASDIRNYFLYDRRGLLAAEIDGEGGLTRHRYDRDGQRVETIRGQRLNPATLQTTPPTLETLPAAAAGEVLETTTYAYDVLGRLTQEARTLASGSETTNTTYDAMGRVLSQTTQRTVGGVVSDQRTHARRYDALGNLVGELTGEGAAALAALGANPTTAQVDTLYRTYGVTYTYDAAGRVIARRQPNGFDAGGLTTLSYYDAAGRLAYVVNPLGYVTAYAYDQFGALWQTRTYATPIALTGLTGGAVTADLTSRLVASATADGLSEASFDALGRVKTSARWLTSASSVVISYAYNTFGEVVSVDEPVGTGVVRTEHSYDRRGLLLQQARDPGGLQLQSSNTYDAFGRVVSAVDAMGRTRSSAYDRNGRVLQTTDATGAVTAFTYDARGNVLTRTDRTGKTTQYAYTAFNRQMTVTTAAGVVSTVTANSYGQTITVTDGAGRTVSYAYDKNGAVTSVTDGAGSTVNSYDKAGRVAEIVDARGVRTVYAYDAAGQVLTQTVDPTGLNLVTQFAYDGEGRQVRVTDPAGVVTTIAYDRAGRRTQQVVDPAGLNLRTDFTVDAAGRTTRVVEGAGTAAARTTDFTYDAGGRLTEERVDPTGLNLTTRYAYDKAGNVVARTDAAGGVTRFAYDGENRQVFAIGPTGSVVGTLYDGEGRVAETRVYATALTTAALSALPAAPTAAQVSAAVTASGADQRTRQIYDADGRIAYSIDAASRVIGYLYDGSGKVLRATQYADAITIPAGASKADVDALVAAGPASSAANRVTRAVYDSAGRTAFAIDALGYVTRFGYDAAGLVTKVHRHATAYAPAGDPALASLVAWSDANVSASDRIARSAYDKAGRLRFEVDAEGYISEQRYDAAGRATAVRRLAGQHTLTDAQVTVAMGESLAATATLASATTRAYDSAGRLVDTYDGLGTRTHLVLNARGDVTQVTVAYGTGDASTTERTYDAAGRLLTETQAAGRPEATTTRYGYDGAGRVTSVTDGRGHVSTRTYDAAGRVLEARLPIDAATASVTAYTYDAFGNIARITDPNGAATHFYYDALNRQTQVVDGRGFVTETRYGLGGQPSEVIRYANAATGYALGVPPTLTPDAAKDAVTLYGRDKLDRVVSVTDAMGHVETATLNAFGDVVGAVNRVGGTSTRAYDRLGRVKSETIAFSGGASASATSITKTYAYDANGALLTSVEAAGRPEARTTTYTYDLAGRLVEKRGDDALVFSYATGQSTLAQQRTRYIYDRRGNVIETVDTAGARTLTYVDGLDRRVAEIKEDTVPQGPRTGAMTRWTYDANGNVISSLAHARRINLPATAGGAAPTVLASADDRTTTYIYDQANRLIRTSVENVRVGQGGASDYAVTVQTVSVTQTYDLAGNLKSRTDGRGMTRWWYYDAANRLVAEVDPERYLTRFERDGFGNIVKESKFAARLAAAPSAQSDPAALAASLGASADDRVTGFTYDQLGRRTMERRRITGANGMAEAYGFGGSGPLTGGLGEAADFAEILYTYDGLGNVLSRTEATGDVVTYVYDSQGRLAKTKTPETTDHQGNRIRRTISTAYDALGQVTQTTDTAEIVQQLSATLTYVPRTTTFTYGAGGRMLTSTDAAGFTRNFAYDAAGRAVAEYYSLRRSDDTFTTVGRLTHYDAQGKVVRTELATVGAGGWTLSDAKVTHYDAFGQVSRRGGSSGSEEYFVYDNQGRVVRSNSGDGAEKVYVYDAAGNATLTLRSHTGDVSSQALSDADIAAALTNAKISATINVYDARNQSIQTIETRRQLSLAGPEVDLVTQRVYNAFGEIAQTVDARGAATDFFYNTMGRLVLTRQPQVKATSESGVVTWVRPESHNLYDLSGRLVGVGDANGNFTTRRLLAGTGYDRDEAVVIAEYRPDSGSTSAKVNEFGEIVVSINELGHEQRAEYDLVGRLVALHRPVRADTGVRLSDYYAYDGLSRQIQHWNNVLTVATKNGGPNVAASPAVKERTDYDAAGRIVRTVDFMGGEVTYNYEFVGAVTSQGRTTDTWRKTTTKRGGTDYIIYGTGVMLSVSSNETFDYFGRTLARTDFGGHEYTYTYDLAGRLASMKVVSPTVNGISSGYSYTTYEYYDTSRLYRVQEENVDMDGVLDENDERNFRTTFEYDANGNKTSEVLIGIFDYVAIGGNYKQVTKQIQNASATYDAMNRLVTVTDGSYVNQNLMSTSYEYDANGNIRRQKTDYTKKDFNQPNQPLVSSTTKTQDYWYRYDNMNRFIVTKGALSNGVIVRGANGIDVTYDAAGQRRTVNANANGLETYYYTEDGYISKVTGAAGVTLAVFSRDAMGRVVGQQEGRNSYWNNGQYMPAYERYNIKYNNNSEVIEDRAETRRGQTYSGPITTTYTYTKRTIKNSNEGSYYHEYYDGQVVESSGRHEYNYSYTKKSYEFKWYDGALLTTTYSGTPGHDAGVLEQEYDRRGNLIQAGQGYYDVNDDGRYYEPKVFVRYLTNYQGQTLLKYDSTGNYDSIFIDITEGADALGYGPKTWEAIAHHYYYFDGRAIGDAGPGVLSEVDYVTSVDRRTNSSTYGPGINSDAADFDQSYRAINSFSASASPQTHTVKTGDTLQSIAQAVWGDASLWWLIADANGIRGDLTLTAGRVLTIPAKVMNLHNNSNTFKIFNPNVLFGDLSAPSPTERDRQEMTADSAPPPERTVGEHVPVDVTPPAPAPAQNNISAPDIAAIQEAVIENGGAPGLPNLSETQINNVANDPTVVAALSAPPEPEPVALEPQVGATQSVSSIRGGGESSMFVEEIAVDAPEMIQPPPVQNGKKKKKGGCGTIAKIIVGVVAVVATGGIAGAIGGAVGSALGAGSIAANVATGALAAAGGNVLSQGAAIALGVQEDFSFKQVGMAMVSGGVGAGVSQVAGGIINTGSAVADGALTSMAANTATQGVAVATGLQAEMDWVGVAAAGAGGAARTLLPATGALNTAEGVAQGATNAVVNAGVTAGTRTLLEGSDFGQNFVDAAPGAIAVEIGNGLDAMINPRPSESAPSAEDHGSPISGGVGQDHVFGGDGGESIAGSGPDGPVTVAEITVVANRNRNWFERAVDGLQDAFSTRSPYDNSYTQHLYFEPPTRGELQQLRQEQQRFETAVDQADVFQTHVLAPTQQYLAANPQVAGGLQVAGGTVETVAGGLTFVGGALTSELGIGIPVAVGGAVVTAHGVDTIAAGIRTIRSGQPQVTYTNQALQGLGMSPQAAALTETFVAGIAAAPGGAAATLTRAGSSGLNVVRAPGAMGGATAGGLRTIPAPSTRGQTLSAISEAHRAPAGALFHDLRPPSPPGQKPLISDVRAVSATDANKPFVDKGWGPPYSDGSRARTFTTSSELEFARVTTDTPKGQFLVRPQEIAGMTPEQIQVHLALPKVPTNILSVRVPEGTRMQTGFVAPQPAFGVANRGGIQYQLLDQIPTQNFGPMRPLR
jgi:YD repeat-containing protein